MTNTATAKSVNWAVIAFWFIVGIIAAIFGITSVIIIALVSILIQSFILYDVYQDHETWVVRGFSTLFKLIGAVLSPIETWVMKHHRALITVLLFLMWNMVWVVILLWQAYSIIPVEFMETRMLVEMGIVFGGVFVLSMISLLKRPFNYKEIMQ